MTSPTRKLLLLIVAILVLSSAACVWVMLRARQPDERTPEVASRLRRLHTALDLYREAFGAFPKGASEAIINSLLTNPAKTGLANRTNVVIDPWGTPYKINIQTNGAVTIRSAGPNRVPDDSDDVLMERQH